MNWHNKKMSMTLCVSLSGIFIAMNYYECCDLSLAEAPT